MQHAWMQLQRFVVLVLLLAVMVLRCRHCTRFMLNGQLACNYIWEKLVFSKNVFSN